MNHKALNKKNLLKKNISTILLNSLLLTSFIFLPAHNLVAKENLSTLQKQIKSEQKNKKEQSKLRKKLENQIADSEQKTARASLKLRKTEELISVEKARLQELKDETKRLKVDKSKHQKLLEQQLISAYMAGQNDLVKLLLNQEDLSKIIRAKSYYHYLNKARLESIEQLQTTQLRLEKNKDEQAKSLLSLQTMRDEQVESNQKLKLERNNRSVALRELKQDINYQSARLAELGEAEKKLVSKLKKQKEAIEEQALAAAKSKATKKLKVKTEEQRHSKISTSKGQLKWPIRGKVLARFGTKRSQQVKWKGISIAANEGEKVRAVATGHVLFAGYFKGYGMVIALDHSDDYITLYGYNQTLLQQTGDIVFQGDAIALAGHSGGQEKSSLYFELSHKGKAQNPLKWLEKRNY